MTYSYLVHYGEIALKGRNRPDFERKLAGNIERQHPGSRVERRSGRMLVRGDVDLDLSNVFGIAWWASVIELPVEMDRLRQESLDLARAESGDARTFAVRVRRADKSFELTSQELETVIGADLDQSLDLSVDLDNPDLTLGIEVADGSALLFVERREGPRGLPVGISGRLIGLYSAGIDSAVAAYLMGKRGAEVELVHFHALASAAEAHQAKAGKLAARIADFFPSLTVHYIPYHHFQMATSNLSRHQRQELVVFRRFMARVAEQIAAERGALGLFSGDNLGQVASQTLENLRAVDEIVKGPLFRPLVAYDKQEIIDLGILLGFDPLANLPYKDCCSIIARHPTTRAHPDILQDLEEQIGMEGVVERTLTEVEVFRYSPRSAIGDRQAAAASL
jgi:thiamine biosynthesis protein ThiI